MFQFDSSPRGKYVENMGGRWGVGGEGGLHAVGLKEQSSKIFDHWLFFLSYDFRFFFSICSRWGNNCHDLKLASLLAVIPPCLVIHIPADTLIISGIEP